MGSFVLDFSAYNALLYSHGQGASYYGSEDACFGGGDPGLSMMPGRRGAHHLHPHLNQQQHGHHNSPHSNHLAGQNASNANAGAGANANGHTVHQINNRYIVYDRNSLPRLEAEKGFQDRRKQQIANFGATWLKPPGVPKTLFQIREECREQEEQAEAERREELQQQLAQAAAQAAALEGEGEGATAGDWTGEPGGATDLMDNDAAAAAAAAAGGMDADMPEGGLEAEEDGEHDLDNDIPDADGGDFSFGNNNDGDDFYGEEDPFASAEEDEDDDEDEDEADEGDDGNDDGPSGRPGGGRTPNRMMAMAGPGRTDGYEDGANYTHSTLQTYYDPVRGQAASAHPHAESAAAVATTAATPVRTVEEQREQARARAAERREMRQMRATEDRMRAMRAHPRLSSMGIGMGMYGDEDDLDEEDQAQMLQEDDLVRETNQRHPRQQVGGRHMNRSSLGGSRPGNAYVDGHPLDGVVDFGNSDDDGGGDGGLEMDMDADLDGDIPEGSSALGGGGGAMDLSVYEGGYEHTDSEAELSSSSVRGGGRMGEGSGLDGGLGSDLDFNLEPDPLYHRHLHLPPSSAAAPRTSVGDGGFLATTARVGGGSSLHHRNSVRRSSPLPGQSDHRHNASLDISSLLSRDGGSSSNVGSSPQARRR